MSAASASWQGWNPWWAAGDSGPSWRDHDEPYYKHVPPDVAGEELVHMLTHLKSMGTLSAKQTCVLAFWAAKAGACGEVKAMGVRPDQEAGEYSKRYDKWAGVSIHAQNHYPLWLGLSMRHDAGRYWGPLPSRLPHEAFKEEMLKWSRPADLLRVALANNDLPPKYWDHEFVKASPPEELVHPFSLYLDGVPFSRHDSVLGFWAQLLFSPERHLLFVIRKSEMCGCGCGGWCSLHPIMSMLSWSLAALGAGHHPARRHDNEAWKDADLARSFYAAEPLGFRGVCLFLKGDWSEFVNSLGFPGWADRAAPCLFCKSGLDTLYETRGFTPTKTTAASKTLDDYLEACRLCERRTVVTKT